MRKVKKNTEVMACMGDPTTDSISVSAHQGPVHALLATSKDARHVFKQTSISIMYFAPNVYVLVHTDQTVRSTVYLPPHVYRCT